MTLGPTTEIAEVTVDRVAHGGSCVGRLSDGRVIFVRHALPGERVRVRVTEERDRYLRGDAVEVLAAAPDRVRPPCPYAGPGRCGGCDWQHASLDLQRRLKADVVREQLARLANLDVDVAVEPLPDTDGCGPGLGWRTRVELTARRDGRLGFHGHRSAEVHAVETCLIAHPFVDVPRATAHPPPRARSVEITVDARTRQRQVTVHASRGRPRRDRPAVVHRAAGRDWRVSGSGFWQVHPAAADVLADAVVDALKPEPGAVVLDLYAGVGLFAGVLAREVAPAGRVLAVEGDAGAVRDMRHNLADVADQVSVVHAAVGTWLEHAAPAAVDLLVLDPPRAGAGERVMRSIAALRPRRMAYVSCDPATLARDLAAAAAAGLHLSALRAFDLFPMTAHVECLATLEPR